MTSSGLRRCETCHQSWPRTADHDLRSFRWLDPLPRHITISNGDCFLHDGLHGRDRFLMFEVKMPWEPALQAGQNRLLRALAGQPNWTVRLLWGRLDNFTIHRVTPSLVERDGVRVEAAQVRNQVVDWINGQPWSDPRGTLTKHSPGAHTCGWARVDGLWLCVQDFYAVGDAPATGCGAEWTQP